MQTDPTPFGHHSGTHGTHQQLLFIPSSAGSAWLECQSHKYCITVSNLSSGLIPGRAVRTLLHRGRQQNRRKRRNQAKQRKAEYTYTHIDICIPGATDNRGVTPCPGRREDKEGNAECTCAFSPLRVCRWGCSILPVKVRERRSFGTFAELCRLLSPAPASFPRSVGSCRAAERRRLCPAIPHPPPLHSPDSGGDGAPGLAEHTRTSPCPAGAAAPPSPSPPLMLRE